MIKRFLVLAGQLTASAQGLYNPLSCHFKSPDDCPYSRHLTDTRDEEEMESGRGEKHAYIKKK